MPVCGKLTLFKITLTTSASFLFRFSSAFFFFLTPLRIGQICLSLCLQGIRTAAWATKGLMSRQKSHISLPLSFSLSVLMGLGKNSRLATSPAYFATFLWLNLNGSCLLYLVWCRLISRRERSRARWVSFCNL